MADHSNMQLGCRPARPEVRTLDLASYLNIAALPPVPHVVDWTGTVPNYGMMCNDRYGCCVEAGRGHGEQLLSAAVGPVFTPLDKTILSNYFRLGREENPGQRYPDNGLIITDMLDDWEHHTASGMGKKIHGRVSIDPQNAQLRQAAIYLFRFHIGGYALPVSAQKQDIWDVPPGGLTGDGVPGSWGGHCVVTAAQTGGGAGSTCITWGAPKLMTENFIRAYCTEAYAVVSDEWDGKVVDGFDSKTLLADLAAFGPIR